MSPNGLRKALGSSLMRGPPCWGRADGCARLCMRPARVGGQSPRRSRWGVQGIDADRPGEMLGGSLLWGLRADALEFHGGFPCRPLCELRRAVLLARNIRDGPIMRLGASLCMYL